MAMATWAISPSTLSSKIRPTSRLLSLILSEPGVDPCSDRVRRPVALVRDHCRWEHAGQPFFSGEVEPCINGRTVTLGTYFDQDVDGGVARLLSALARNYGDVF